MIGGQRSTRRSQIVEGETGNGTSNGSCGRNGAGEQGCEWCGRAGAKLSSGRTTGRNARTPLACVDLLPRAGVWLRTRVSRSQCLRI